MQQWSFSGGTNTLWTWSTSAAASTRSSSARDEGADRRRWRQRLCKIEQKRGGRRQSTLAARARRQGAYRIICQPRHQLVPRCRGREARGRREHPDVGLQRPQTRMRWLSESLSRMTTQTVPIVTIALRAARSRAARNSRSARCGDGEVLLEVRGGARSADRTSTSRATRIVAGQHPGRPRARVWRHHGRLGRGVTGFREGDRVVSETAAEICGTCLLCRTGRYNLCPDAQRIWLRRQRRHGAVREACPRAACTTFPTRCRSTSRAWPSRMRSPIR